MFSIDQLSLVHDDFNRNIELERQQFSLICKTIEQYIIDSTKFENPLIVGGLSGTNLLLDKPNYSYEVYGEHVFKHANNLANRLQPVVEKNFSPFVTRLRTVFAHKKYVIAVGGRSFIEFHELERGVGIYKLISPVEKPIGDGKALVMSPEAYLLKTYRELYTPGADWETALEVERELVQMTKERFVGTKTGGKSGRLSMKEQQKLSAKIMREFIVNNNSVVLIGEHSVKILENLVGSVSKSSTTLRIISANNVKDDIQKISLIVGKITAITRDMNALEDHQLVKTIIRVETGQDSTEILYLYNSASYNLIPYNVVRADMGSLQIGNPFVILRFLLIDLWEVNKVLLAGKINETFAKNRINNILKLFLQIRETLGIPINDKWFSQGPMGLFQMECIGTMVDEGIVAKKDAIASGKFFAPYYPKLWKKINGEYRDL